MTDLSALGWGEFFQTQFDELGDPDLVPGRVSVQHRDRVAVQCEDGERFAFLSGRVRHDADAGGLRPAVGDWVVLRDEGKTVHQVLNRRSAFVRQAAGDAIREQVIAANIDTAFVVTSFNRDFNPRRIERYLTAVRDSGAQPVVVLNKADLCGTEGGPPESMPAQLIQELGEIAVGVPAVAVSALEGDGLENLAPFFGPGKTVVLVGSSGVGKSTLVNALLGDERQAVGDIRDDDDRGRHTTTHRELLMIPGDRGLLVDTPGMRELRLRAAPEAAPEAFADIEELAGNCKFRDCAHAKEPGCAVRDAVPPERLASYLKLQREISYENRRRDVAAQRDEQQKWKKLSVQMRQRQLSPLDPKIRK